MGGLVVAGFGELVALPGWLACASLTELTGQPLPRSTTRALSSSLLALRSLANVMKIGQRV